jgi:hypothetical protein
MKHQEIEQELHRLITLAINEWFNMQCRQPETAYYLYYEKLPHSNPLSYLRVSADRVKNYELADSQRLPAGCTKEGMHSYMHNIMCKLPIINSEEFFTD